MKYIYSMLRPSRWLIAEFVGAFWSNGLYCTSRGKGLQPCDLEDSVGKRENGRVWVDAIHGLKMRASTGAPESQSIAIISAINK